MKKYFILNFDLPLLSTLCPYIGLLKKHRKINPRYKFFCIVYNEILYIFKSSLLIKWQGIICFKPNVFAFLKNDIKSPFRAVARMGSYDFVRCRLTISLQLIEPKKQKAPDCVIKCRNDIVSGWKSPFFFAVRGWRKQGKEFNTVLPVYRKYRRLGTKKAPIFLWDNSLKISAFSFCIQL